jgi:hypothetical protein
MLITAEMDRTLRQLTGEHRESRPFVCSGSPIGCEVAEIGINPGTPTPFWERWSTEAGFDKAGWLKDYLERHKKFGPTRRNIDLFCEALRPLRCIELNLYDRYSPRLSDLAQELRRTEVLDYMLEVARPRLILVHGDDPAKYLSQLFGTTLVKDAFTPVRYRGLQLEVLQAKSHFMKVGKEYVHGLASRFTQRLQAAA